ncbi:MAG: hypothetical protein QM808_00040 [Steroidobacteraceae bacterium]
MTISNDSSPAIAVMDLREFFHDSVQHALHHQHVAVDDHTEHYLVNVLTTFARTEALYQPTEAGMQLKPLACMLAEASAAPSSEQQRQLLQRMGDVSLFMAGFFAHSFARKLIDIDYQIAMGGRAYACLADNLRGRMRGVALAHVFAELAAKFQRLVDVLNEVADMARPATDRDVLRLYEIWLKTGSPRAQRLLSEAGVTPVAVRAHA